MPPKAGTLFVLPMSDLLRTPEYIQAQKLWAEGHYWEVHEALEPLWLRLEGTPRALTHGLILLAAALHKAQTNPRGGQRNFAKALRHLSAVPAVYAGIDVTGLIAQTQKALQEPLYRPRFTLANP